MKRTVKLLSIIMALALALSMFAGCGNNETGGEAGGNEENKGGEKRDDVVIATANEPPTLAPFKHSAIAATYMNHLTHDHFLESNMETLTPEAGIIKEWKTESDKEWIFTIRDDVTFHDGTKVVADDLKATMEYARENQSYTSNYSNFWESIEVIDDTHFKVTTKTVYAKTLNDMASHWLLPKSAIEAGNDFNKNPIGTGPYKLVKQVLGDSIEFESYDEYWQCEPSIKHVTWRIIPEGSSRTIALEAGEIDFIVEVETNDLERLEGNEKIAILNKPGTNFNFLTLNNEVYPFDNQDFRHALNCAINKEALVDVALNGAATPNSNQTPLIFEGTTDEGMDPYDLEKAKEYIEKSGIDPTTIHFSCICSDDVKRRCGEVIQANLQELGITMDLESMDLATYLSAAAEGNFEATIGGVTSSNSMGFIEYKFHSKSINGSNFTRTADDKLDEMWTKASQTLDDDARNELLEQCSARLNELCPHVPTYIVNVLRAYNADLQGVEVNASGNMEWERVTWAD